MPRTAIAATVVKGPYVALPTAADSLDLPFVAADVANKNSTPLTGKEILIAHNTDGAASRTITFTSVADGRLQRTGDVSAYSLGIDEKAVFYFADIEGWRQADGSLYFEASNAAVKFAVVRLP